MGMEASALFSGLDGAPSVAAGGSLEQDILSVDANADPLALGGPRGYYRKSTDFLLPW